MRTMWFLRGGLVLAFTLASCAPSTTDTVADGADKAATATSGLTDTPLLASTEPATNAPLPTQTDIQTTAAPTSTPATALEPTSAPANSSPVPPTTAPATTAADPVKLATACLFDDSAPKISCSASGVMQGSQLRWESNVAGWLTGPTYEFTLIESHQLVPEVIVTLQECQGSDCVTVETKIDTSVLVASSGGGPTQETDNSNMAALPGGSDCPEDFAGWFTTFPLEDHTLIYEVGPPGRIDPDAHRGHGYFRIPTGMNAVNVRMPVDATLYMGSNHYEDAAKAVSDKRVIQYRLEFRTECEGIRFRFDHIAEPVPKIVELFTREPLVHGSYGMQLEPLFLREGELVGTKIGIETNGNAFVDFGVYDDFKRVPTAQDPRFENAACFYEFFSAPLADYLSSRISRVDNLEEGLCSSAIVSTPSASNHSDNNSEDLDQALLATAADLVRTRWSDGACEGTGTEQFAVAPISPDHLDYIKPLGHITGAHITPTSHQKWFPLAGSPVDVRAPTSGRIIWLTNRGTANSGESFGGFAGEDYEVQYVIEVSCNLYLIIDHVLGVPDPIVQALGTSWDARVDLPLSAGELLGEHSDGSKIDIGVIDLSLGKVPGLIRKESYYNGHDGEAFKLFERDSFEYFDEPLRLQLAEKSLRASEPRGGIFAYDVDGTAQGNWFEDGTNGYMGTGLDSFGDYWSGHLALVPDSQEPSKLRVSIGDGFVSAGMPSIWGVTGDSPLFESVTNLSGPTTYELRRLLPCDGSDINVKGRAREFLCNQESVGILLIELIDHRTMRVEVFYQVASSNGLSFSGNARTYVR